MKSHSPGMIFTVTLVMKTKIRQNAPIMKKGGAHGHSKKAIRAKDKRKLKIELRDNNGKYI